MVGGAGVVFDGRLVTDLVVTTTAGDVRVNGAAHFTTDTLIDAGGGTGDIFFTADALVDSQLNRIAGFRLDAEEGRIAFNEDIGADRLLAALTIIQAVGGFALGFDRCGSAIPVYVDIQMQSD